MYHTRHFLHHDLRINRLFTLKKLMADVFVFSMYGLSLMSLCVKYVCLEIKKKSKFKFKHYQEWNTVRQTGLQRKLRFASKKHTTITVSFTKLV